MTQAIRTLTISGAPIEAPIPIATRQGLIVEACRFIPHEDDLEVPKDPWIIRERDPVRNVIRESTELFGSAAEAIGAYWSGPWPIEMEAWVSPLFSTGEAA